MITATKTTYDKYPTYKDSGVEWLGEIPEHWEVRRFKYLFKEINERSSDGSEDLLSVSQYTGVTKKSDKIEEGDLMTNASTLEGYKKVSKNDLVSNIMLAWNGSLGFSPYDGITSPAYSIYRIEQGNSERFFHYLVRSGIYKSEFKRSSSGIIESRLRLYTDDFFSIWSLLPPLQEQQKIAKFLDEKTEKIDRAIAQKEKMIALLKERKQIIIQDLVTGKKVWNAEKNTWTTPEKTKDSGVEWIGKIPENWEVKKLFGLSTFIRGNSSFSKDELQNTGAYIALQYGKVYQIDEIDENYEFYVDCKFYKNSQTVTNGDVVLISTSETIEDLGHSAYYKRNDVGLLGGEQIVLKPHIKKINPHYLFYSTRVFSKELRKFATGIKVYRFNINDLKTIYLPLPSSQEQSRIVSHIEEQSAKIDKAIALQERQIEKLKELKSTLIDSAVTGKLRVPSVQKIKVSDYAE